MVKSKVNNLHELLSKSIGNDTKIIEQNIKLLTAPGEHYGSVMLAVDVTVKYSFGKQEVLHLVAKLLPTHPILRLAFDIYLTFKKEVFAYTETIPTLVRFQKRYGIPEERLVDKLFPKCYGARLSLDENKNEVDEDAVLVFENLKIQGYKTEDRLKGFDFDAAKIIVSDLARFHATPLALRRIEPELFKQKVMPALIRNKSLEQLPGELGEAFHNSIMEAALETYELKPYLKRLQEIVDYAAKHPYVNRPPPKDLFATMAHSDYWVSNTMLLKDKQGKPLRNKIVDLQIMTYSSAVRDLIFFLFTSVMNPVLEKHCDELLKVYFDSFIGTLEDFNLDITKYNWEAFIQELDEVAPTEVYHVLVMLKPVCTEKGKLKNSVEEFQDTDWSRKDLLGPYHSRKLRDTVLALAKRNWL